jgi:hypothetical protein
VLAAGGVKAMQGLSKTFRKPESQIEFMYPKMHLEREVHI